MNQCPPGSQGVRGQLSTGPSGPLDVCRKDIFQPNFSYVVFLVHTAMGRLIRWDLGGQGYGVGQAGRRIWKGFAGMGLKNWDRVVGGQGCKVNIRRKLSMGGG